jgi:hypothetical protein
MMPSKSGKQSLVQDNKESGLIMKAVVRKEHGYPTWAVNDSFLHICIILHACRYPFVGADGRHSFII